VDQPVFYAVYTMAVPVLVTLTDRFDAGTVYLSRSLMWISLFAPVTFGFVTGFGIFVWWLWREDDYADASESRGPVEGLAGVATQSLSVGTGCPSSTHSAKGKGPCGTTLSG
jgi:hypothetical protein